MKALLNSVALACALSLASGAVLAQAYPNRPVKLIVPFAPGGFTDVVARILGQKLSVAMGQQFVVENKAGAGSTIGTDFVAKAAPDGYTLVMVSTTHVISPSIYKNMPYDPIKSFTVISKLVDSPYVLLVNPKLQARNVQELVALAKAAPETIHYASSGNGSSQHLMGGLFVSMTGAPLKHVPYRGSGSAATDLVAGVVESSFAGVPNALSQVPQGRLRALAVTTAKRIPQLPDVPTMQEAGVPGYEASVWLALLAPAGTPRDIVVRLNSEIAKVMSAPETKKALYDAGVEPTPSTPEAMADYMVKDMERWAKVIRDTGIKLE
ncbi:MAG: tripartite tricarboxylate transporter substrate binding protein [Polaromonas sp.]|jgi:tripartite-type tricarboxylate transporter receptor subunit TctC|uniref:Bug family tripartite tricarboxylate transporter substrate binding protein n=1 Tax=Polaromonas sp. TaxID=1869339 RepID=UPI0027314347|nr:tripartite tricarboxylate transporter substrate binding protein [Polaromonas sp.]MDP2255042.1 tripartite tricarboxylate transporter substrate binding protein [Polaromonas sp.]MDP3708424.1 tripartite tricarboxylate transporter substrate binding protein [Polaromonas sp.]